MQQTSLHPHTPLTDAEWTALRPHLDAAGYAAAGPGRPLRDARARLDAIFLCVARNTPWAHFSTDLCRTDTLARHFRRLARAGLWTRLLKRIAAKDCPAPLRAVADRIMAAHRRAARLLGLSAIVLARRLGLPRAMPGPPWYLPDPDLSGTVMRYIFRLYDRPNHPDFHALLRTADRVLRTAAGRRRVPRCLIPV